MEWDFFLYALLIGLCGGVLGGLLGIGGSIVVIPLLTFVQGPNQQLYQAAAMIMNVAVAASATIKHALLGAIPTKLVLRLLPASLIGILVGVAFSNAIPTTSLQLIFALFLAYLGITELVHIVRGGKQADVVGEADSPLPEPTKKRTAIIGSINGIVAGLLGIGGGIVLIPLLRRCCGIQMRGAIAASSATMLVTATIGATYKNLSLPVLHAPDGQPLQISTSLLIAAGMIPTAFLGSFIGAGLTHRLPLKGIKLAFALLILIAGLRMVSTALTGDSMQESGEPETKQEELNVAGE